MHEAGHAVAAVVLGMRLWSVTARQRETSDGKSREGFTHFEGAPRSGIIGKGEEAARPLMVVFLAGSKAEASVNDRAFSDSRYDLDNEAASQIITIALCPATPTPDGLFPVDPAEINRNLGRFNKVLAEADRAATDLVNQYLNVIKKVAERLLERQELQGDEVVAIVKTFDWSNGRNGGEQ
jgi:hypothetical protein